MVLPGRAAVRRAHEAAELDAGEDDVGVVRARSDPADVRRPRARRKAPRRRRRKLAERGELLPVADFGGPRARSARSPRRRRRRRGCRRPRRRLWPAGRRLARSCRRPRSRKRLLRGSQRGHGSGFRGSTATHCAPGSSRTGSARPSATRTTASPVATKSGVTSPRRGRGSVRRRTRGRSHRARVRRRGRGRTPAGSRPRARRDPRRRARARSRRRPRPCRRREARRRPEPVSRDRAPLSPRRGGDAARRLRLALPTLAGRRSPADPVASAERLPTPRRAGTRHGWPLCSPVLRSSLCP